MFLIVCFTAALIAFVNAGNPCQTFCEQSVLDCPYLATFCNEFDVCENLFWTQGGRIALRGGAHGVSCAEAEEGLVRRVRRRVDDDAPFVLRLQNHQEIPDADDAMEEEELTDDDDEELGYYTETEKFDCDDQSDDGTVIL